MALIQCPDCGRQHSDLAAACPECGRPMAPRPTQPTSPAMLSKSGKKLLLYLLILIAMIVIGVHSADRSRAPAAPPEDTLGPDMRQSLAMTLREMGYLCGACDPESRFQGLTSRNARKFRVICDEFRWVYDVTIPHSMDEPWIVESQTD